MGGRATSDNLGSIRLQGSLPFGPESVRGGNRGERHGEMGAMQWTDRTEQVVIVVRPSRLQFARSIHGERCRRDACATTTAPPPPGGWGPTLDFRLSTFDLRIGGHPDRARAALGKARAGSAHLVV